LWRVCPYNKPGGLWNGELLCKKFRLRAEEILMIFK
jgi:hypothetical protein